MNHSYNVCKRSRGLFCAHRSPHNLLGRSLIVQEGTTKMLLFDGGYAKANRIDYASYDYTFFYYTQDHLGNNREVLNSQGEVPQRTNYYPFGGIITDNSGGQDVQPYKYNGKELDLMHGLNTYDYGARQYNPVTARWDRVDPLCEKYYSLSPYAYCHNNPVMMVDPDGRDDYYTSDGTYIGTNSAKTDYIYISNDYRKLEDGRYVINVSTRVGLPVSNISAEALSKIFTHIVGRMPEVDLNQLDNKQINVVKWSRDTYGNGIHIDDQYGNCQNGDSETNACTLDNNITVFWGDNSCKGMLETRSNIQNMLGGEEYTCHFKNKWHHYLKDSRIPNKIDNDKIFNYLMNHPTWNKTTDTYKHLMINYKNSFLGQ